MNSPDVQFDVIIVGGGAAGLFCAGIATKRGLSTLLLEKGRKFGAKILISGGGRCNFTNLDVSAHNFLCPNPHFAKSALSRYTPWHFIELLHEHGLSYEEKTLGQLFCTQKSRAIVQMLLDEAKHADLRLNQTVNNIQQGGDHLLLNVNNQHLTARNIVIATGGASFPGLGASDFALQISKQFGLTTTPFKPALVPLTLPKPQLERWISPLAGVSLPVIASTENAPTFRENVLFTHRGLSGPVILQISSYAELGKPIMLNALPDLSEQDWANIKFDSSKSKLHTVLNRYLPKRFVEHFAMQKFSKLPVDTELANWRDTDWLSVWTFLTTLTFYPDGDEGLAKAEVCTGGIHPDELSSKTMMCERINNLYFIGEAVDVTGWLGGYNFQWAWASAHACAMTIKK